MIIGRVNWMKIQIKGEYITDSDIEQCVYDVEKICDGIFCNPHPCKSFLDSFCDMSQEQYEAMKQYSIIADVAVHYKSMR
jgi:hypothetical protein